MASLENIYKHVENLTGNSETFGIVTSWRAANSPADNKKDFHSLKGLLKSWGLGWINLEGHWQECQDPNMPYNECPPELLKNTVEPSLFVPSLSKEQALRIALTFEQDAVIWGKDHKAFLIFKDKSEQPIGKFSPNKISQAYSKIKGTNSTFIFERNLTSETEQFLESLFEVENKTNNSQKNKKIHQTSKKEQGSSK
jgi:hypothetical protein